MNIKIFCRCSLFPSWSGECTYSMEQSSSWETIRFSANQEIPRVLWNPKVHYRDHKCLTVSQHDTFYGEGLLTPRPTPPTWRTSPCRLSETVYSIYSQPPSILEAVPPSATWGRAMPWWQTGTHLPRSCPLQFIQNFHTWRPSPVSAIRRSATPRLQGATYQGKCMYTNSTFKYWNLQKTSFWGN
jgi:hypothetical protein